MKGENQERRKKELWRFKGRIERESEKRSVFLLFLSYGSRVTIRYLNEVYD